MKLYKISQNKNKEYDTFDSAIVCAENEEEARKIHPSYDVTHIKNNLWMGTYAKGGEYETENGKYKSWVDFSDIDKLKVEYIGEAKSGTTKGVILASYNAG